jgi:hypothetical protein
MHHAALQSLVHSIECNRPFRRSGDGEDFPASSALDPISQLSTDRICIPEAVSINLIQQLLAVSIEG